MDIEEVNLAKVHEVYKKWLHIEDEDRIDVVLAVALSRQFVGTPLWLILVGKSGDGKSEQLETLIGWKDSGQDCVKVVKQITSKTLVSGNPKMPDLAPLLKDKILLIPEMASILKKPSVEKAEIWGQLRDLYDGNAGKQSGSGKDVNYTDIRVTFIAGSTPAFDKQVMVHQDLGSRELIWRTKGASDMVELFNRVSNNERSELLMKRELKEVTHNFLQRSIDRIEIEPEVESRIRNLACFLQYMRATADVDHFTGELLNEPHAELPTRLYKQFKRLYLCLKSLDKNYPDEKALRILKHIAKSSSFQNRMKVFEFILAYEKVKTMDIVTMLKIGKKTAYMECNILWALGIVKRRMYEYRGRDCYEWIIDYDHPVVKFMKGKSFFNDETCPQCDLKAPLVNGECELCAQKDVFGVANDIQVLEGGKK